MTDTLLWVDVETVGLGEDYGNRILEVGWLFTGWDIKPNWPSLCHYAVHHTIESNKTLTKQADDNDRKHNTGSMAEFQKLVGREGAAIIHRGDDVYERYGLPSGAVFEPHLTNGLLDETIDSRRSDELNDVLDYLRGDIQYHLDEGERVMLAGSSVGFDKSVLTHARPSLFDGLHYHLIDFSVLNETMDAWASDAYAKVPAKVTNHRVTTCLHGSIAQGQAYRSIFENSLRHATGK